MKITYAKNTSNGEKATHRPGKNYTQIIYPRRDLYPDYIKPVKASNIKTTYPKMDRKYIYQ